MPMWDERDPITGYVCGYDGWDYCETPAGKGLVVRRATFWSALWNYGLSAATDSPSRRPMEGRRFGGWRPLGDYRGMTGWLHFEGPVTGADIRLIIESLAAKAAAEAVFVKGDAA